MALGGAAVGVLISGVPGIGKTRLAAEIVERARARGARVGKGSAWDLAGAPAFWPWSQALAELVPREALEQALQVADARFAVLDACTKLVRNAGEAAPIVVWLEDLHAADIPTLVLARFLLRHVGGPFALIATHRPSIPTASAVALAELARECTQVRLEGLGPSELRELIATRSGTSPSDDDVQMLARSTAGHPLFVLELVDSGTPLSALRAAGQVPLPPSLKHAIEAHLGSVTKVTRDVLAARATLAPEHAVLTAALAGVEPPVEMAALSEARTAGILFGNAFAHALFGEVLLEAILPDARSALHARAAELLAEQLPDHPTSVAERARHLLAAGAAVRDTAIDAALDAAGRASELTGWEESVRWAEAALKAIDAGSKPDHERRARAEILLGLGVRATGLRDAGTTWLERAIEHAQAASNAELLARAAIAIARGGTGLLVPRSPVREALEQAIAGLTPSSPLRVEALSALALALRGSPQDSRGLEAAREAVDEAERLGEQRILARALDASLTAGYSARNLEQRLSVGARLMAIGDAESDRVADLDGRRWLVGALMERGDLSRAEPEVTSYLRAADEGRLPGPRINATSRAAQLAFLRGSYESGEQYAREACAIGLRAGDPTAEFLLAAQLVVPLHDRARDDELALAMPPVRAALAAMAHTVVPRVVLAAQLAFSGQLDIARREARLAVAELAGAPDDFVRHGLLALLIWTGSILGLSSELAAAEKELEPFADRVACAGSAFALGSAARYCGLAAEARGDTGAALRWYRSAVDANAALGARPYEARSCIELARVLRTTDEASAAALEARASAIAGGIGLVLSQPTREAPARSRVVGTLRREGQGYRAGFGDRTVLVRDSRGLGYLASLIAQPSAEVHVLALAGGGDTVDEQGIPLLDAEAKEAYRQRVNELREVVAEAEAMNDLGRASRARTQLEALTAELARAVGLGGRDRRAGASSERARMAVRVAIRRALDVLEREHPPLAAHLGRAVRTGAFCCYDPDPSLEITWDLG